MLPMLLMGKAEAGPLLTILLPIAIMLFAKYFDAAALDLLHGRLLELWTSRRLAFSLRGTVVSGSDEDGSCMSTAFMAVAWNVHATLGASPGSSPVWRHFRGVKELRLLKRNIVCRVFSDGWMDAGGVRVEISSSMKEVEPEEQHRDLRFGSKRSQTTSVDRWTIKLTSDTFANIDSYIRRCELEFEDHLESQTSCGCQTLCVARPNPNSVPKRFCSTKTLANTFWPGKGALVASFDAFLNGRDDYARRGKPYSWKRMFHGPPGTGKTSAIKALANHCRRNVVVVEPGAFITVHDMVEYLHRYPSRNSVRYSSCMFVIEEFDCFEFADRKRCDVDDDDPDARAATPLKFKSAEDRLAERRLALAELLTAFDGIDEKDGFVAIFTTNHVDKFDPALVRPGRLELALFDLLGPEEIAQYWTLHFDEPLPRDLVAAMAGIQRVVAVAQLCSMLEGGRAAAAAALHELATSLKNASAKAS